MKELEQFLENELNGLALKKADWGHLTIEDDSRERTLLEVQELVKKLPIHNVVGRSEQFCSCESPITNGWYGDAYMCGGCDKPYIVD